MVMDKEELKQYLKENLTVSVAEDYSYSDEDYMAFHVTLNLEGDEVCTTFFSFARCGLG